MADYAHLQCPCCGVKYWIPEDMHAANCDGRSRKGWYCPNGHHLTIKESEADRYRRENNRLAQRIAQKDDEIKWQRDQREAAERSASAYKGQVTKLKRRAKAGMCPCCKRSFVNLARHMATKHPDMDPEEPLKVIDGGKA